MTGLPLSPADLAVTALTPPPATRLPGETFSLTATVKNNGTEPSPTTTTKFNLVNALVNPTKTKNLKGVQIVDPLAVGATNATAVTVEVYGDTDPGTLLPPGLRGWRKAAPREQRRPTIASPRRPRSPCRRCPTSS